MIFTVLSVDHKDPEGYLFTSWEGYRFTVFHPGDPDVDVLFVTDFKVRGRTYKEKQAYARDLAIEIQHNLDCILSWSEFAAITGKLYSIGRQYGLRREFRENGLI